VLDDWAPAPKFYDVSNGSFDDPELAYIPFAFGKLFEMGAAGNTNCWKTETIDSFERFTQSECIWIEVWVELRSADKVSAYRAWLDNYVTEQKKLGRFPRPLNNALYNVDGWLEFNDVVGSDRKAMVLLAFAFLAVCLVNTVGLLLAKFMRRSSEIGVRRALGASRREIFAQYLVEAGAIGLIGGIAGLGLALLGLWAVRQQPAGYAELAHIDPTMLATTIVLAVASSVAAGLLPAWRAMQITPAIQLKSQ